LNVSERVEFARLRYPNNVASLWFFGAHDETQDKWVLIGDMLREQRFVYGFDLT
jgi:hypothetical protein